MAQMLFDPVAGSITSVDNSSVMTVHSLLDTQIFAPSIPENSAEDEDVFQCGKCKKQFTSITLFVSHKKEGCQLSNGTSLVSALQTNGASASAPSSTQNTVLVQKIQVPTSPLPVCTQNVVLTETDLLSLAAAGLDQAIAPCDVSTSQVQLPPNSAPSVSNLELGNAMLAPAIQPIISQLPLTSSVVNDKDANILPANNKVIAQLFFMRQPDNSLSNFSGVVLNIADATPVIDLGNPETNEAIEKSVPAASGEADSIDHQGVDAEKDLSTVKVIAEFHSSMVKTKKKSMNSENEEDTKKDHRLNCAYCCKSFTKNFDLQQHIRCHTGEKPFQCIVCGRAFAQKSNVKKHMQTHKVWPDGLSHTLPKLNQTKPSEGQDNSPENQENELSSDAVENGEESEVKESSYACPYCPYIGKSYYRLKSHMKEHETKKVYKCILDTCGLMFSDLDPFLEHTKSHENEMTYRCHECNKNFPTLCELGAHQYTHSLYPNQRSRLNRGSFRCTHCLNKYSTPAALNHHLATSSHMYNCTHCEKVFPCERYLRRHLRIHTNSEHFLCTICNKGFKTDTYLKIHMLTHSGVKPFQCNFCKSAFNRKDKLKRHLLIHEPVKKFKCPFRTHLGCMKEFSRPDKLKAHVLTHGYFKAHSCRTCGQEFKHATRFKEHMKLHKQSAVTNKDPEKSVDSPDPENDTSKDVSESVTGSDLKCDHSQHRTRPKVRKNFALIHRGLNNHRRFSARHRTKKVKPKTNIPDLEIADDIPTAHIEIISTDDQIVNSDNLTEISLTTNFIGGESISQEFQQSISDVIIGSDSAQLCNITLHPTNSTEETCSVVVKDS